MTDLALGHLAALQVFHSEYSKCETNVHIYNLGTGVGYSVLELVNTMKKISGCLIPTKIAERRPGDVSICYADCDKAFKDLGWKARQNIEKMCQDSI